MREVRFPTRLAKSVCSKSNFRHVVLKSYVPSLRSGVNITRDVNLLSRTCIVMYYFAFSVRYIGLEGLFRKSDIVHNFFLDFGGPILQVPVKKFFLTKYLRLWEFFFHFTARYIGLEGLFRKSDSVSNFFLSLIGPFLQVSVEKFFLTKYLRLWEFFFHFTARYIDLEGLFRKSDFVHNFFLDLGGPLLQVPVEKFFITKYSRLCEFFFHFTVRYIGLEGLFRKSDFVHNFFLVLGGPLLQEPVEKFFLTKYLRLW